MQVLQPPRTSTESDLPDSPSSRVSEELVIREARSRQRQRRRRGVVAGLALVSLVAGLAVTTNRGGSGRARSAPSSPHAVPQITSVMKSAGSADVSLVLRTTFLATVPIVLGCHASIVHGSGIIGFTNDSIELHLANGVDSCSDSPFAMQERQIGNVLYQTDPSGSRRILTSPGKPWLKSPWATPAALPNYGYGGVFGSTTAGFVFTALRTLRGPVTRIGTRSVHGVTTTGYRATITLMQLQMASRAQSQSTGATFEDLTVGGASLPRAADIPISVAVWVDSNDRIRQLQATEPVYALNYGDGSGVIGTQIYPSEYLGRQLAVGPYRAGSVELTLTLMNFGTSQTVSPPPRDQVTKGMR
jgi:hypothetical protein